MNDRRDGANSGPGGVARIVADLETVDRKLARASGDAGGIAEVEEARALLRAAIDALARPATPEAGEDAGAGKRRVKIKAESEVAASDDTIRADPPAKTGTSSPKAGARSGRSPEAARAGRRPQPSEKEPNGSLIARLGAATTESVVPTTNAASPADVATPKPDKSSVSPGDTAERLAQLEAEIADLAEAVTATPARAMARQAATATTSSTPEPASTVKAEEPGIGSDDEEDAEITIIGADGAPAEPTASAGRQSPRIFREGSQSFEEEAEVEIRGSGAAASAVSAVSGARGTPHTGAVRVSARTSVGASRGGALGKWRIFRGS